MSVVFINTTFESFTPTESGAIGTWIWEVCQAASHDGVEPTVISYRVPAEPYPWKNTIFLDHPSHDFSRGWKRILRKACVLQTKFGGWYHIRHSAWCRRVGDAIEKAGLSRIPFVLQNDPQLAVVLRRRFPEAFILHLAQNQNECPPRFRRYFGRCVNVAAAVSDYTARWNEEHFSIDVKTLYSGVNQQRFRPPDRSPEGLPFINFVGRTVHEKGPDLLLRAARVMVSKTKAFGVQILGFTHFGRNVWDGYQQELQSLASDLEANGITVRKPGFIDRHRLPSELQRAQIHVHPARWDEAFGLATLEGMAVGLATVAAKTGGTPEVVGNSGFLFERGSVDELASYLYSLVSDATLRADYAERARRRASEFTWMRTWNQLRELARV